MDSSHPSLIQVSEAGEVLLSYRGGPWLDVTSKAERWAALARPVAPVEIWDSLARKLVEG